MRCQQRLLFFLIGFAITSKSASAPRYFGPNFGPMRCTVHCPTRTGPPQKNGISPFVPNPERRGDASKPQRSIKRNRNPCFSNVNRHPPGVNYSVAGLDHRLAMQARKALLAQESQIKKQHFYYVTRFWKVLPIIGFVTMVTNAANSWGDREQIVVFTIP